MKVVSDKLRAGVVPLSQLDLTGFVSELLPRIVDAQKDLPKIARDPKLLALVREAVARIPTYHSLHLGDARKLDAIPGGSVHLVLTSPPYWTLKKYRQTPMQMGHIKDYDEFLSELDRVWSHCHRMLVPGGRLICVVGDVCLSRRQNEGRHTVVPLHSSIQEHCRRLGFDNLAPIIWYKISNARHEVENGSSFLGKPYEPNAVIKNDIEFILMERKHGGYRKPVIANRILSVIGAEDHRKWFQQIWSGLTGASTRHHPAPFPVELAERLVRMFSFVGDTVLDPFMGTGTTTVACAKTGRNSIGVEVDENYFTDARIRIQSATASLFSPATITPFPERLVSRHQSHSARTEVALRNDTRVDPTYAGQRSSNAASSE